jgi:hypothetical protein
VSGHHLHKPFAHSHHHHVHVPRPFAHHRPFHRPFFPFVIAASPSLVYAATPVYSPPPVYYAPPVYHAPPVAYAPPAPTGPGVGASAPMPTIVQHAHGRYELRGDGASGPYRWVWIPNPPPPPPVYDEPSAEPRGAAPSDPPAARRSSELYRWTDEQGVVHWTDRRDAVPEPYRGRAKPMRPS